VKCLSLWQPWASLVWLRKKRCETRHWATAYRGPLLIHAAQHRSRAVIEMCRSEPFKSVLAAAGFDGFDTLPRGVILCKTSLLDCVPTESVRDALGELERAFGDYRDGRFALPFGDVVRLAREVPFAGRQKFFDVPDRLLG
jgi:hypothetical protein